MALLKKLKSWYQHRVVMKEKKVAVRGRAYVPTGKAKLEPVVTMEARKYSAKTGEWTELEVTDVKGQING